MVTVNFEGAVSFYPHTPDRAAAQAAYDTEVAKRALAPELAKIRPWASAAAAL